VVVTRGLDRNLVIYPVDEWQRLSERIRQLPYTDKSARDFRRLVFALATDAVPDKQGRILIPAELREYAGINDEAVVVGMDSTIEVWSPTAWQSLRPRWSKKPGRPRLAQPRHLSGRGGVAADPSPAHVPVLYQSVLAALAPRPGGRTIDGTVGAGGHAAVLLEASGPDGRLLGLDRDPQALAVARARLAPYGGRVTIVHGTYLDIPAAARAHGFEGADAVLLDLGLSSLQLADPARGFTFQTEGPLDMRFDPTADIATAADIVNNWPVGAADLLYRYGEERQSRAIAGRSPPRRPLRTTGARPSWPRRPAAAGPPGGRGRPGTRPRAFQALRIAVNDELGAVAAVLPLALDVLALGGRLVRSHFIRSKTDREDLLSSRKP
jgi:16S rRNA (cytosine1402-N4)-methyltransferase